jgi:quercetin 2,3-dioxygenase
MKVQTKNSVFHAANSRGQANHGWLTSRHTFSFANYYNPDRIHFGALRVLNDDIVKAGMGFGTHPHDNMEIISIPLSGSLAHKDSTGNEVEIKTGEVQIMSAGTGIYHSEYNHSKTEEVNFLQIWILPKEKNISPRYGQKDFSEQLKSNNLVTVVSPVKKDSLWINQDAELTMGNIMSGNIAKHKLQFHGNGAYVFLIEGEAMVNEVHLSKRDAVGFFDLKEFNVEAVKDSKILIIEIPKIY